MDSPIEPYAGDILHDPRFLELRSFEHHGEHNSVYDHSLSTAETAYKIARWMRLSEDEIAHAVRATLLHDFFGYDWHGERFKRYINHFHGFKRFIRMHAFIHGPLAASRAKQFFGLCDKECEAISRHMFPLAAVPNSLTAWIVTVADKVVAAKEMAAAVRVSFFAFCNKIFA